jgi:hypothetical protein
MGEERDSEMMNLYEVENIRLLKKTLKINSKKKQTSLNKQIVIHNKRDMITSGRRRLSEIH